MKVRAVLEFEVDDQALEEHDGERTPPPNDPANWTFSDLFRAHDADLIEEVAGLLRVESVER